MLNRLFLHLVLFQPPFDEWGISFSPDGKTIYFVQGSVYWTIVYTTIVNGKWITPRVASFSGKWKDSDPFVSPDGKKIFFVSNRPIENSPQDKPQKNFHIWFADYLGGNKWGHPHHIGAPVNIEGISNFSPSVSQSGNLYFSSINRAGHKGEACFYSRYLDNQFENPKLLSLNGDSNTGDVYISPNENYLIFLSGKDIYVTYRTGNNWNAAEKLSSNINTGDPMSSPYISPDGKMLFYTSNRTRGFLARSPGHTLNYKELLKEMASIFNGHSNIFYVPITLRQDLRK